MDGQRLDITLEESHLNISVQKGKLYFDLLLITKDMVFSNKHMIKRVLIGLNEDNIT